MTTGELDPSSSTPEPDPATGPQVVVVDDHRLVREALVGALEAAGITVLGQAADAHTGIELVGRLRPDVVLLDLLLPDRHGVEVVAAMAEVSGPPGPGHRIVVLSQLDDPELVALALQEGAVAYLTKGAALEEIVEVVRDVHAGASQLSPSVARAVLGAATHASLTPREREVLEAVVDGATTVASIAEALSLSPFTAANHLRSIRAKLEVGDLTGIVLVAARLGIINLPH